MGYFSCLGGITNRGATHVPCHCCRHLLDADGLYFKAVRWKLTVYGDRDLHFGEEAMHVDSHT